jgi:hypothetical protein
MCSTEFTGASFVHSRTTTDILVLASCILHTDRKLKANLYKSLFQCLQCSLQFPLVHLELGSLAPLPVPVSLLMLMLLLLVLPVTVMVAATVMLVFVLRVLVVVIVMILGARLSRHDNLFFLAA